MADVLKEAIRLVIETEGREGIDQLRKALAGVGDVSAETVADTDRLLDSLVGLNDAAAKAARFQQLTDELEKTTQALDHASREAIQFSLQLAETEKPSKKMQAEYRGLREEVARLEGVQKKQAAAQEAVGRELREAGIDATKFSTAERTLRANVEGVTTALQKQVGVIDAEAAATRKQKQATADADDAFRKFAQAGTASAEALKRYREGADGAAAGTRNLADQGGRLQGMFSGLRSLIAPVLAYLSFSTAIQGIKNLAGVGAAAENARRSLQNLYGGVEEGNRAYEGLRNMAKENGIAFNDLVETAKKLKAFGLDPLNGSLQALIDQNAAVGGSMQDLDGKVLALGQAWAKQKLQGEEILQLLERGVPVWDLLQKATGKNVTELQKLSSAGALGRDVIRKLYEEIGKQNAGAAAEALFSLSGGIQQLAARWDDFLQRVADNGVTDYFKKQIQSLLGGTLDIDKMAKRVADGIIGMLEAIRTLGAQLAPVGSAIGNLTLFLAKHAEAIFGIVKAWALFRAVEIIAGFGGITGAATKATAAIVAETTATTANTAAKEANAAAAAASAAASTTAATASTRAAAATVAQTGGLIGAFKGLGERIATVASAAVQMVRVLGIPAAVIASVYALTKAYEGVVEANNKLWLSESQLRAQQQDQLRLGQQLQAMYREGAAVAIQSGDSVAQMTRDQANDYKFALEQARLYYRGVINEAVATGDAVKLAGAREKMDELGQAIDGVRTQLEELKKAADPRGLQAFADAAVTKFDEVVTKSKDAKAAISGIFDGIDLRTADGIKQASDILTQIAARGTDAGRAVRTELGAAISKVAIEDLPKLKAQAEAAMAAGVVGAKEFQSAIAAVNLQRLGVDIDAIKTGFTAAGRSAVDAFKGAVAEVDNLGLTVEQRSAAIAQAFDNAFKQASTKAELAALKAAIQDALSSGDIGFQEFQARIAQVDAKLAEVGGTGKKMGSDVAAGAGQASSALSGMSGAAGSTASSMGKLEDATEKGGRANTNYGKTADAVSLGLEGINAAAGKALLSLNKLQISGISAAGSGRRWAEAVNNLTREMRAQLAALNANIAAVNEQNAAFDENEKRLIELRRQYGWLADNELQRLIDAENELEQNRKRAAEEAKQKADEAAAAYREQSAAAEAAAKAAAESGSVLTGRSSGQSAQAAAAAATQVLDSAASAADSIRQAATAVSSAELTLRVIAEPNQGTTIVLTQQQINDISAAVIRALNLAKGSST